MSESRLPPGQTVRVTMLTHPLLNYLRVARPAATGCAACGRPWRTQAGGFVGERGHLAHYQDSQPLNCERCGVVMDVDCYRRHIAVTAAERLWWEADDDDALVYIMVLCPGVPALTTPALALLEAGGDLDRGRLTLTQAARSYLRWMSAHVYAKNTLLSYGFGLSEFLRYAEGVKLRTPSDVTVLALDGYFVWLQAHGASARTAAHRRAVLIGLWAWLEHEGFADRNIAAKTYKIKYRRGLPVYLEAHQIDAFLGTLATLTDPIGRRDHAIVATLFYSGLRVGELAALTLASVDTVARRIRVLHGEGDKDRTIVLPPRLAPILAAYIATTRPALLARPMGNVRLDKRRGRWRAVFTQDGRKRSRSLATEAEARATLARLSPPHPATPLALFVPVFGGRRPARRHGLGLLERAIYAIIRDRAHELLGVKLSPHKLRHTCASYLLAGGAQLETIQRHLGHVDIATTMIYLHVPQQRQDDEIGRVFA